MEELVDGLRGVGFDTFKLKISPPPYEFIVYQTEEVFRITQDGRVVLGPGASLDKASLEFWKVVDQKSQGMCEKILKERVP